VELVVALIVIIGLVAVAARFLFRAGDGRAVRLPRMVDDSIGMWMLRRLTGRPLGDSRLDGASAAGSGAGPRPFDAAMAARLGIRFARDVAPPRRAAGAWVEPDRPAGPAQRRLGRFAIAMLAIAAVVAGLAVGAGLALLAPQSGVAGTAGQPASASSPPASTPSAP
jgi:hypothetical protein